MIKVSIWFDYNSIEKFKESFIYGMLSKIIDFEKCIAFKTEVTEDIR